jgi:hypothetical protein
VKKTTKIQRYEKGSEDDDRSKEADRARWGRGWDASPSKPRMNQYLVLGEPKRLEARTGTHFIDKVCTLSLILIFGFLLPSSVRKWKCFQTKYICT